MRYVRTCNWKFDTAIVAASTNLNLNTSPLKDDSNLLTVLVLILTRERERGGGQTDRKTEVSYFMMLTIVKII